MRGGPSSQKIIQLTVGRSMVRLDLHSASNRFHDLGKVIHLSEPQFPSPIKWENGNS